MTPSESHTLTPSMRSRILYMWDSGTDTYDIAEALGLPHESIVYNAIYYHKHKLAKAEEAREKQRRYAREYQRRQREELRKARAER